MPYQYRIHMKFQTKKLILGIDAGATKTMAAASDMKGKILARGKAGSGSFNVLGSEEICENIAAAIFPIIRKLKIGEGFKFQKVAIGMAGLDAPADFKEMKPYIKKYFTKIFPRNFTLVNDVVIALHSGTTKGHGVGIIGGTGSNCYGINADGREAYTGGLGHLLSDEGSAYMLGLIALHAATRSFDGRGPKTVLESVMKDHFRVKNFRDITRKVYHEEFTKSDTGSLAPLVEEAAKKGDKIAQIIMEDAIYELGLMAATVIKKLKMEKQKFDIVTVGGVFEKNEYVYTSFGRIMKKAAPKARVVKPRNKPVMGAIRLALRN